MTDIITLLSSDDETNKPTPISPPNKRIKLHPVKPVSTICLDSSDDEEKPKSEINVKNPAENGNKKVESEVSVNQSNVEDTCDSSETRKELTDTPESLKLDIESKLSNFIEKCLNSITIPEYKERLSGNVYKLNGFFQKLLQLKSNMDELDCMLHYDQNANYDSFKAIKRFAEIFEYIKSELHATENELLISGPKRSLLKKLEKTLLKVRHKIRQLDEAEVDFDDDENSHYIQASRYKERAKKIYEKICELRKENPNSGRPLYAKVHFSHSKYPEFNKTINTTYRNTVEFPTFFDIDKRLRQCVQSNGLLIPEDDLKSEIKHCFEKLGKTMKQKRKMDLHELHNDYIHGIEDPAANNEEMNNILRENYASGSKKMEEIFEKYVKMQDGGIDPTVSPDSDDSNVDSD